MKSSRRVLLTTTAALALGGGLASCTTEKMARGEPPQDGARSRIDSTSITGTSSDGSGAAMAPDPATGRPPGVKSGGGRNRRQPGCFPVR